MKRATINIDFLGIGVEVAQVRYGVTIGQLIQEILVEFGLDYLFLSQHRPENYALRTAANGIDLPSEQPVHLLGKRGLLYFREKEVQVPETAVAIEHPFYLRYRSHVFKICWSPSLIGRPIPGGIDNDLLAVDLEPFSIAVSRRQAKIICENGHLVINSLSDNPVLFNGTALPFDADGATGRGLLLQDGDTILLQRSGISLTCLKPSVLAKSQSTSIGEAS